MSTIELSGNLYNFFLFFFSFLNEEKVFLRPSEWKRKEMKEVYVFSNKKEEKKQKKTEKRRKKNKKKRKEGKWVKKMSEKLLSRLKWRLLWKMKWNCNFSALILISFEGILMVLDWKWWRWKKLEPVKLPSEEFSVFLKVILWNYQDWNGVLMLENRKFVFWSQILNSFIKFWCENSMFQ